MKKLLLLLSLLGLLSLPSSSQPNGHIAKQTFTYNLALGDTALTTGDFSGFSKLSFQVISTGLDAADAVIQIEKSNNLMDYLDISGATLTLASGNSNNFIKISGANNVKYKIRLTVNAVTTGTIGITLVSIR